MKERLDALMARPVVAHLLRANTRFGNRLGNQFAAAITYFSVLALVPIIMFAFSLLGFTVTTLRPELLDSISTTLAEKLGSAGAGQQIVDLIQEYLKNWRGVGLVGLVSLLYAGSGWAGNLRGAVQAQWEPEFTDVQDKRNIALKTLSNAGVLLLLLVGVLLTFALSLGGTALTQVVMGWLDVNDWPGGSFFIRLITLSLTAAAAWLLFLLLFTVLPREHRLTRTKMVGALVAALVFTALQLTAGLLMSSFSKNRAASLFGPVIVMMLFMNLFARVILFVSAWIATKRQPAVAYEYNTCDEPVREMPDADVAEGHWERADEDKAEQEAEKAREEDRKRQKKLGGIPEPDVPAVHTMARPIRGRRYQPRIVTLEEYPKPDPKRMVSEPVAARSVRAGIASGWVVGAATGVGLGAVVTGLVSRLRRR